MDGDVAGHATLWLALAASLTAAATATLGASWWRGGRRWEVLPEAVGRWSLPALGVAVAALAAATGVLGRALVGNDFALTYVADFSRRGASRPYRLAALWGGMAGSLLTFATIAGFVGAVAAVRQRRGPGRDAVVGVVAALLAALTALVLGLADPFERLALPPVDGAGLPPILEHPAMLYHPPLLYLGLATLAAPFALTVARLAGRTGPGTDATVRHWLLVPWTLLAVGMLAGAHWAYVELGWGGYWAWDPVENTALLPWLAVTLALHAGLVRAPADRRGAGGRGQAVFVCIAFLLALTGTMLTRSGAVPSVHAFAEDVGVGRALAALVGAALVGVVALFVRRPTVVPSPDPGSASASAAASTSAPASTEAATRWAPVDRLLVAQLAVVGALLAITFVGTIAPLADDLAGGQGLAIEGRYFASFAGPLAAAGLALAALVPVAVRVRATAGSGDWPALLSDALVPAGVGAILGVGILTAASADAEPTDAALAATAGAALSSGLVGIPQALRGRRRVGAHVAHVGVGLLLLGIAGTAAGRTETVTLAPGDEAMVQGQVVTYRGVYVDEGDGTGPGGSAVVAELEVAGRERRPALVAFPELGRVLAETSLVSTGWRDVQVALADATDDGTAVLRVGVHPLQVWVWWGGLVVVAAGVVTFGEHVRPRRPARSPGPD